jgi:hypothetical protein
MILADLTELVGFKSSIRVLPRVAICSLTSWRNLLLLNGKHHGEPIELPLVCKTGSLKPSEAIFRRSCGDSPKKFAPALVLVADGGRYHRSEVSCLRCNREKTSSLPVCRSRARPVDGSSDKPPKVGQFASRLDALLLNAQYRTNRRVTPQRVRGGY